MNVWTFILLILLPPAALYLLARLVGIGTCMKCHRACNPWDAYCWEHRS